MEIDENTKIIGRFHSVASPRGLNIYNPLFEELGINALYILFYDPDPKKLFDGLRQLKLSGAVTVGFETDPRLAKLVDKFDATSKYMKRVGFVTNNNGILTGHVQSGEAMYKTVSKAMNPEGKKLVIVGAGNVAKCMLFYISGLKKKPSEVEIYNRDVAKAKKLVKDFKFVKEVGSLSDLQNAKGDIIANVTQMGGSQPDDVFTSNVVKNFKAVADVTFETENTNLIKLAKKLKKKYSTGWDMFTYQGQIVLETILGQKISAEVLRKHVVKGLSQVVK